MITFLPGGIIMCVSVLSQIRSFPGADAISFQQYLLGSALLVVRIQEMLVKFN